MPLENNWVNQGSFLANPKLSEEMRMQAAAKYIYRPHSKPIGGFGAGAGDSVNYDKSILLDSTDATLNENEKFRKEKNAFVKDTITVDEKGLAIPYTQKVTTLSKFSISDQASKILLDHQLKSIDKLVKDQMVTAKFKVVLDSATTTVTTENGVATATAASNLKTNHINDILELAKTRHIPRNGPFYNMIGSPRAIRGLYQDLEAIAQFADPQFRLQAEVGKYIDVVFQEDANLLSNALGGSFGEAIFFGDEAVSEAVALPEQMRNWEEDGGRAKFLAWYAILGFKKTWDLVADNARAAVSPKGLERIIHITSA